jgi:pyruvate-formate lyase-activating enzyme
LKRCYEAYIHTAVETCGNVPWENYKNALPYLDWIFYDLKILNENNFYPPAPLSTADLILENARRISAQFHGRLIFRVPVVPGYNSDQANIERTARFILSTGRNEINILPLHHLGREKYKLLDKKYMAAGSRPPSKEELQEIASQFESLGITCYTGSETPF